MSSYPFRNFGICSKLCNKQKAVSFSYQCQHGYLAGSKKIVGSGQSAACGTYKTGNGKRKGSGA
jgi:hypothetical protein